MPRPQRSQQDYLRDLLRRVLAAEKADGFRLMEVVRRKAGHYLAALEDGLERGIFERVPVKLGVWFYRLTERGREAGQTGTIPVLVTVSMTRQGNPPQGRCCLGGFAGGGTRRLSTTGDKNQ